MKHYLVLILTALSIVLLASAKANAEDVSFDVILGPGAMICDLPESVTAALTNGFPPDDCGTFRSFTGSSVTVTIIGEYLDKPLARFDFHNPTPWGNDTQYGWWAGDIPGVTPAGIEA